MDTTMAPRQFLEVLIARRRLALVVLGLVISITAAVSWVLPRQYAATASVLVDLAAPDPLSPTGLNSLNASSYMATQMDVVASERVGLRVINALKLDEMPQYRQRWEEKAGGLGDFAAWLSDHLLSKLEVLPTRESGVMWITFTENDPQLAAAIANAFMQGYIDTALELRVEPAVKYTRFFDERSKQLRESLEQAQTRLSAFQQQRGMVASDERLDVESSRLTEFSTQLVIAQAMVADSSSRQQQAGRSEDASPDVASSAQVSALVAELARQQRQVAELLQRLGDNHPQVRDAQAAIEQLRRQVATEKQRVSATVGATNQINQARVTQLRALLEAQRSKVLQLRGQRDEAAVLQRDVENAQRAFDAVQARSSQTQLESKNTQTNVSVLKFATAPARPSSPKVTSNLLVAGVLGLLLAVTAVTLRELSDRRLRTADDVTGLLKLPLLVVLPNGRPSESVRSTMSLTKRRVLRGLPRPAA